ncbi:hypothetical protein BDV95DRAFT_659166 [Massariosphaeria phaeospora]|uniref:Uncharacterized protein n=1 Tax=Massariosphaeria phaeospora TaxID=100035 RepID=A0A7C8MEF2_9PLEO|nr:hypothetical protein BDV95DRAFT_659166 [Massariosphaeria phaeospora]
MQNGVQEAYSVQRGGKEGLGGRRVQPSPADSSPLSPWATVSLPQGPTVAANFEQFVPKLYQASLQLAWPSPHFAHLPPKAPDPWLSRASLQEASKALKERVSDLRPHLCNESPVSRPSSSTAANHTSPASGSPKPPIVVFVANSVPALSRDSCSYVVSPATLGVLWTVSSRQWRVEPPAKAFTNCSIRSLRIINPTSISCSSLRV